MYTKRNVSIAFKSYKTINTTTHNPNPQASQSQNAALVIDNFRTIKTLELFGKLTRTNQSHVRRLFCVSLNLIGVRDGLIFVYLSIGGDYSSG